MLEALHVVVDVSSSDMVEYRNVVRSELSAKSPGMFALTAIGSLTTANLLSEEGHEGYEHIHTIHELGTWSTAALDSISGLRVGGGDADLLSALMVVIYSFTERELQRQQQQLQMDGEPSVLLLCGASLFAQDVDDLDVVLAHILEPMQRLGMRLRVASLSPLPESRLLRALSDSLRERYEFTLIEAVGLRGEGDERAEGGEGLRAKSSAKLENPAYTAVALPAADESNPATDPKGKLEVKAVEQLEADAEAQKEETQEMKEGKTSKDEAAIPSPPEEKRVDPSDGNAYTRDEWVEFYGGPDEWHTAFDEATVDLARRALQAHLEYGQLNHQKAKLRALNKSVAPKDVREAMAVQFADTPSTSAGYDEALHRGGGGGGGGEEEDTFADWDLRPKANATHRLMPKGGAFLVTGALAPTDYAEARARAARAQAPSAASDQAVAQVGISAEGWAARRRAAEAAEESEAAALEAAEAEAAMETMEAEAAATEESMEAEVAATEEEAAAAAEAAVVDAAGVEAAGIELVEEVEVVDEVEEVNAPKEADAEAVTARMEVEEVEATSEPSDWPAVLRQAAQQRAEELPAEMDAEASSEPAVSRFGEADEYSLADASADVPMSARHLRPEEAATLTTASRPPKRLEVAADDEEPGGPGDVTGASPTFRSLLSRLLDHELPFARILLFLTPEEATLLATAPCRDVRQRATPLYHRYCRVVVRRLEAESRASQSSIGSSDLVPPDALGREHFPADGADGEGGNWEEAPADGIAAEVWAEVSRAGWCGCTRGHARERLVMPGAPAACELTTADDCRCAAPLCLCASQVRALVDEAACNTFCCADVGTEEYAPFRLRSAVKTLREIRSLGKFQLQTIAAEPNKLTVSKEKFEGLAPADQRLLLERGVIERTESVSSGGKCRLTFSHTRQPRLRPIDADVDVGVQLASCQQNWKVAENSLESLKASLRLALSEDTKVEVFAMGTVKLGKRPTSVTSVRYKCPGGEATFKRELSNEEQERLWPAFSFPQPLLHVRTEAVGREQGIHKRGMTLNRSGRTLTATFGGRSGDAAHLPSHAFAERRS